MIAYKFNSLCQQAEQYYYDFLCSESNEPVPEFIINHINQCPYCNEQITKLKSALSQVKDYIDSKQNQISIATAAWLRLHFAYIGKRVTCETVKPFLPGFLEPALKIKIPTPITVHLDNCQQCRQDLKIIRELNLNSKQLCRLSQLFAEEAGKDTINCSQAQAAIASVVSMNFSETDKETLKHLCVCPDCLKMLYEHREIVRNKYLHTSEEPKMFLCREISANDYFDYVVPYGLDPAADQYAKFRSFFTSHSSTCPICLTKMQQLHSTIYNIAKRAESEVVTIYHIDESAKIEAGKSDDIYAGFPIRIEITGHEEKAKTEQPTPTIDIASKRKISAVNIRPLFKVGVAAAAVILVATVLFLNIPAAGAVTLESIYKAIGKIKNVHISNFIPDKKEPLQEQWVSRTLNINLIKTGNGFVLWDVAGGAKKVKHPGDNSIETTKLTSEMINEMAGKISNSFGLMPFYAISEIPKGAEWKRIDDKNIKTSDEMEVYELQWSEKVNDDTVFRKWRVFADAKTNLPQKVEWYRKSSFDGEYILKSISTVEYPDEGEMQKIVKNTSF
jgi:hypothetical protein